MIENEVHGTCPKLKLTSGVEDVGSPSAGTRHVIAAADAGGVHQQPYFFVFCRILYENSKKSQTLS